MKNKIGILENDIYIFPIVNSVILLSAHFSHGLHSFDTVYIALRMSILCSTCVLVSFTIDTAMAKSPFWISFYSECYEPANINSIHTAGDTSINLFVFVRVV